MEREIGSQDGPRVGVFATCLVDLMRPAVGFATVRLLERAGCRVAVPAAQTCCGNRPTIQEITYRLSRSRVR